jgi:surface carbohydrate biosynthesis protein
MISRKFLSIKWYKDVLIFFLRVKFHFKNPPKNKLIIFDKESIDDLYEIFKDYKYFILENRLNHMNNFYFNFKILKLIIYFYRGNFMTAYLKSMISIINPENVITFIDNSEKFFELAKFYENKIIFSAIQNGARYEIKENNFIFKNKINNNNNNIFINNYFCFGNYERYLYKKNKIKVKNFINFGSIRLLNYLQYRKKTQTNKVKERFDICLLSDQGAWYNNLKNYNEIKKGIVLLIKYTLKFSQKYNLKLVIALKRQKNHRLGSIFFYQEQSFFQDNLTNEEYKYAKEVFFNKKNKYNVYDLIINSKVTVGTISSCLREGLALNKKVLVCNFTKSNIYDFPIDGLCKLKNRSYKLFETRLSTILKMNFKIYKKKLSKNQDYVLDFQNIKAAKKKLFNIINLKKKK